MSYVKGTPQRCQDIIKKVFEATGNFGFICGGFARYVMSPAENPVVPSDIDIYCETQEVYDAIVNNFSLHTAVKKKKETEIETKFSLILNSNDAFHKESLEIQLIKPVEIFNLVSKGTFETILDNFDFTIAKCAIIPGNNGGYECYQDSDFHDDELRRELVISNIHCPISSMKRVIKYCNRGYSIESKELLKLFIDYENRDPQWKEIIYNGLNSDTDDPEEHKRFLRTMYFD